MPLPAVSAQGFPLIGPTGCAQESAMTAGDETLWIPMALVFRPLDLDLRRLRLRGRTPRLPSREPVLPGLRKFRDPPAPLS